MKDQAFKSVETAAWDGARRQDDGRRPTHAIERQPGGNGSADKMNILVVDDREDRLLSIRAVLQSLNHNIVCVSSGREALRRLLAESYAVILLDVNMPGMDGFETAELIRQRKSLANTPIIFITSYGDTPQMARGYSLGAVDFILTPIVPDVLRTKVRVLVELAQMADRLRRQAAVLEARVRERTAELRHTNERLKQEVQEHRRAAHALRDSQAELSRSNRELRSANEAMEQFLRTLSHDLKTPLVTIKWRLGMMREDVEQGQHDRLTQSLGDVERTTGHMQELIEDLLQLSRVGRVRYERRPTDLKALLRRVLENLDDRVQTVGAVVDVQDDLPTVEADEKWLGHVLENLLSNSLKYGCQSTGDRIEIGAERGERETRLFVRDHGPGIAPAYHQRIFEPFERLDTDREGTGIGLAIVSRIIQMHGGRAWVESDVGQGATFYITLPAGDGNGPHAT